MREILFRGKSANNGEWVQGFYAVIAGYAYRIFTGRINMTKGYVSCENFEVDPETVGQFTGGDDINGNKIFEGDIISVEIEDDDYHTVYSEFEVFFDAECYGWYVRWVNDQTEKYRLDEYEGNCEIIGNIHDNPELLNAERNDENG